MKRGRIFLWLLAMAIAALLAAGCGVILNDDDDGGSGGGSASASDTDDSAIPATSFIAGASLGELVSVNIDAGAAGYSYTFEESHYGLAGTSGSGTLTLDEGTGTYTPSGDPDTRFILLGNTLVVAHVRATYEGSLMPMVLAGVPRVNAAYQPAEIAGTYNYAEIRRSSSTDEEEVTYGTLVMEAGGTWSLCEAAQSGCSSPLRGSWSDRGDGLLAIEATGTTSFTVGKAAVLPSSGGGRFLVLDLQHNVDIDEGPGLAVGMAQESVAGEDIGGVYRWNGTDGMTGSFTVDSGANTAVYEDSAGTTATGTLSRDDPWTGWLTLTANSQQMLVLIAPDEEAFLMTKYQDDWMDLGGRTQ